MCALISSRKCAFATQDWTFVPNNTSPPPHLSLADGELYSGTSADFMGRDFAIFRTLGDHHPIRTEQHDSRWLNGRKIWKITNQVQELIISLLLFFGFKGKEGLICLNGNVLSFSVLCCCFTVVCCVPVAFSGPFWRYETPNLSV